MSTFRASTLSPGGSDTGSVRQSPFRRQNSHAGGQRETTPTSSPARSSTAGTPLKMGSLSPEKASPFVRRPSQITSQASERPSSPLARPPSTFGPPLRNVNMSKQARVESGSDAGIGGLDSPMASPTRHLSAVETPASPEPGSPSPLDGMRPPPVRDQPTINLPVPSRPQAQRIPTSSSIATLRQPNFNTARNNSASSYGSNSPKQNPSLRPSRPAGPVRGASAYTSLPPSLLHALRSSFEILDPSATGSITPTTLPDTLQQIGLPAPTPAQLVSHFPPPHSAGLNLATYLDTLSSPLAQLSPPDELLAAFAAFDIDDSGQIDARELREALLKTGPEPGEEDYRMSESEIDGVLGEFVGRRAFGAKGLNAAKGKGEVFRYRDFMANLTGGGGGQEQEVMG